MWDYVALTALGGITQPKAVLLQGQSMVLILAALHEMELGMTWEADGEPLTTAQEDNRDIIVSQAFYDVISSEVVMIATGTILPFAGSTLPDGYLECDGTVVLQADYPELYAQIGVTWNTGGEAGNAFRLPELRGRALIGAGDGPTTSNRVIGALGGAETHVLTTPQMPSHSHGVGLKAGSGSQGEYATRSQTGSSEAITPTSLAGGDQAHNNMQPFAVVKWMIATGE
jgi:microcystin-dependent protein